MSNEVNSPMPPAQVDSRVQAGALNALVQEQRQAANDAVTAPVAAAAKKASAK